MKNLFARFGWSGSRIPGAQRRDGRAMHFFCLALVMAAPALVAALFMLAPPDHILFPGVGLLTLSTLLAVGALHRSLADRIEAADSNRMYAETMREQSETDIVTGLRNRIGFDQRIERLAQDMPRGTKLALLWMDLRRFREVNDTLGHQVGDLMLREVGERLLAKTPHDAELCHFAGDEFIVAVRQPSLVKVQQLAAEICEDLSRPYRIKGNRIESGAMIGVATMPDHAQTPEELFQAADLALYHAKASGRSEVRFFHQSMTRALAHRKEIEAELRAAIQRDELSIFFQPIIDLRNGRIRGFEALVRWFHPERGELQPAEFIPVAEDSGLIITLGNWITRQAARAATTWPENVILAVNLSSVQIRAPGAALGVLSALREAGLDPSRLELEVTESLFLEDDEHTSAFVEGLSTHGVRFSLDDFGTGYSSLKYIHRHHFHTIKVDRSFVSGANTGERSDAIIRAVVEMGATLDMDIVAEGLETIEQVEAVKRAGCTLGQGYYFSRAVPDFTAAMLLSQEAKTRDDPDSGTIHRRAG